MKKITLLFLIMVILSGCQTINTISKSGNLSFSTKCTIPKNSIKRFYEEEKEIIRFTLKNGQKGGCKNDRRGRHSAPYWERTELKQSSFLPKNINYEINFNVRFLKGFVGERETFFQIHQYNKGCNAYPTIMLKFDYNSLRLDTLNVKPVYAHGHWSSDVKIKKLLTKWQNFKIIYNLKKKNVSVFLNNDLLFKDIKFGIDSCGKSRIDYGIYRPGNKLRPIKTSIVDFDNIKVKKISP